MVKKIMVSIYKYLLKTKFNNPFNFYNFVFKYDFTHGSHILFLCIYNIYAYLIVFKIFLSLLNYRKFDFNMLKFIKRFREFKNLFVITKFES